MEFKEENEMLGTSVLENPLLKEPHELSYEEFIKEFLFPAARKYKKNKKHLRLIPQYYTGKLPSIIHIIEDAHFKVVVAAVKEGLQVPVYNLLKYRFHADAFLDIRKYCNKRKIKLDNY